MALQMEQVQKISEGQGSVSEDIRKLNKLGKQKLQKKRGGMIGCTSCEKMYTSRSNLNQHINITHKNKKYICGCGTEYSTHRLRYICEGKSCWHILYLHAYIYTLYN